MSYCLSHSAIKVPNTEWVEALLLCITICMPTGSGKTPLYSFLNNLIEKVRSCSHVEENGSSWKVDDASFKKLGAMMSDNNCTLLHFPHTNQHLQRKRNF